MVAAGAFNFVMLGVIIIIITRNGRVTIYTDKGNTTITIDKTAGGSGGLSTAVGEAGNSRVGSPPVPPDTPSPGAEAVTAESGSGNSPPAAGGKPRA